MKHAYRHRLVRIDPTTKTADCSACDRRVTIYAHGTSKNGFQQWRCSVAMLMNQQGPRRHLKDSCERCGFVAVDSIQLDAHHRDRNRSHNERSNIETLCANCHRLEHPRPVREYTHKPLAPTVMERVA